MTLHGDALATLHGWRAPTPEQTSLGERFERHLERHPDGMTRECRPDHITASTLVLSSDLSLVLLTLHAKANRWFQFGGHCEPGDLRLIDAASREVTEESGLVGLRLDPVPVQLSEHEVPFCRLPGVATQGAELVHHLDVRFLAVAPPGAVPTTSEESLDVRWWPVDTLPDPESDLVELVALGRARYSSNSDGGRIWAASDQPSR